MAYLPKPSKFDTPVDPKSLTEQEHKTSCDINVILHRAARGQLVFGSNRTPQYGHDDLTMDGVSHRILRDQTEAELSRLARTTEFDEEELKKISPEIQKKFGFKQKKSVQPVAPKNDESNNDKKTDGPDSQPKEPSSP